MLDQIVCEHCGKETPVFTADRVSIHGMYDCHLFHGVAGGSADEVVENWIKHNSTETTHGDSYLCPAIVLMGDKELRRVGEMVFVRKGVPDEAKLRAWIEAVKADPDITRLLAANCRA